MRHRFPSAGVALALTLSSAAAQVVAPNGGPAPSAPNGAPVAPVPGMGAGVPHEVEPDAVAPQPTAPAGVAPGAVAPAPAAGAPAAAGAAAAGAPAPNPNVLGRPSGPAALPEMPEREPPRARVSIVSPEESTVHKRSRGIRTQDGDGVVDGAAQDAPTGPNVERLE
jgi:hypothetical protein